MGLAWAADAAVPAAIVALAVPEGGGGVAAAVAFTCETGGVYKNVHGKPLTITVATVNSDYTQRQSATKQITFFSHHEAIDKLLNILK